MSRDSGEITMQLSHPLTEEQWDTITDVDLEHTNSVCFHTKHSKDVEFVKAVRCKDCRHSKPIKLKGHVKCDLLHDVKPYDWFCKDGERREVME